VDANGTPWNHSGVVGHAGSLLRGGRPTAPRVSAAERDWAVRRLRRGHEEDRISLDTFSSRVETVYATESRSELVDLVSDLPDDRFGARAIADAVSWLSLSAARVRSAWQQPRMPILVLPATEAIVLGRSRRCDCVFSEPSVSRTHASLRYVRGRWWLRDLGSLNGTYVNGSRLVDELEVRPGDEVAFGATTYRLASHLRASPR
jgi:hypothetical protein